MGNLYTGDKRSMRTMMFLYEEYICIYLYRERRGPSNKSLLSRLIKLIVNNYPDFLRTSEYSTLPPCAQRLSNCPVYHFRQPPFSLYPPPVFLSLSTISHNIVACWSALIAGFFILSHTLLQLAFFNCNKCFHFTHE